jgi:hypothetical protein
MTGIVWRSWTADGATGVGTLMTNDGVPNCAQGTWTKHPGSVVILGKATVRDYCSAGGQRATALLFTSTNLWGGASLPQLKCSFIKTQLGSSPALDAFQGAWEIKESNRQFGVMVWLGNAFLEDDGTRLQLDVHKGTIAGQPATPCEQNTHLRATLELSRDSQIVPYEEVNCENATFSGEVRVVHFATDRQSFTGSFWHDGVKQGDFEGWKL